MERDRCDIRLQIRDSVLQLLERFVILNLMFKFGKFLTFFCAVLIWVFRSNYLSDHCDLRRSHKGLTFWVMKNYVDLKTEQL